MLIQSLQRPRTRDEFRRALFLVLHDAFGDIVTSVTEQSDRVDIEFDHDLDREDELVELTVVPMTNHEWLRYQRFVAGQVGQDDSGDGQPAAMG